MWPDSIDTTLLAVDAVLRLSKRRKNYLGAEASRELPRRYRLVRGAAMALNVSRSVLYVLGVPFTAGQIAL